VTLDPDRLRRRAAELRDAGHDWSAGEYDAVADQVECDRLAAAQPRPASMLLAATALRVARDEGCTCDPDIRVGIRAGRLAVDVAHDPWCPTARRLTAPTN